MESPDPTLNDSYALEAPRRTRKRVYKITVYAQEGKENGANDGLSP